MNSFERVQFDPQQIVFTRETDLALGCRAFIFTRENHPVARLGPAGSTREAGSSCSLSPGVPLWESAPPGCSSLSSRNPGQPGFRTSGVRKIDVLGRTGDSRPLLPSQPSRSSVMPDPPT